MYGGQQQQYGGQQQQQQPGGGAYGGQPGGGAYGGQAGGGAYGGGQAGQNPYGGAYGGQPQQQQQQQQYGSGQYGGGQQGQQGQQGPYGGGAGGQGFGAATPPPPPPPAPTRSSYPAQTQQSGQGYDPYGGQSAGYQQGNGAQQHGQYQQVRSRDLPMDDPQGMRPGSPSQYGGNPSSPGMSPGGQQQQNYGSPNQMPQVSKMEFFVAVAMDQMDRQNNAKNAAKAQGQARFGKAGGLLGSMMGSAEQMFGGQDTHVVSDDVVVREASQAVSEDTMRIMKAKGWSVFLTPVRLPPLADSPGQDPKKLSPYVSIHGGLYMVYRVQIQSRLQQGNTETDLTWFQSFHKCFENCCAPDAPDFHKSSGNAHRFCHQLEESLKNRVCPIFGHVDVGVAPDMYATLCTRGFGRDQANQVIAMARQGGGDNTAMYPNGGGSPGGSMSPAGGRSVRDAGRWG